MIDITPKIITYCQTLTDLVALVSDRISSPSFPASGDENLPNPKIALRQIGGGVDFYRYQFIVRGDSLQQARQVAELLVNHLTQNAISFSGCELEWINLDGSLNDSENEETGEPEVFFNINFQLINA